MVEPQIPDLPFNLLNLGTQFIAVDTKCLAFKEKVVWDKPRKVLHT